MGRGKSKVGGGTGRKTGGGATGSAITNNAFANKIYDIPKTMAFPSSKSVINNVPSLKAMKETLDNAKVGDTVALYIGGGDKHEDTLVYEKVSAKTWTKIGLRKNAEGEVEQYGGVSKMQGSTLLKSFASNHWEAFNSKNEFTNDYDIAYKKIKKK